MHTERKPYEDKRKDEDHVSTRQGVSKIVSKSLEAMKSHGTASLSQPSERFVPDPANTLISDIKPQRN